MGRLLAFLLPQMLSLLGSSIAQFGIIWTLTLRYSSGSVLFLASAAAFIPQLILMMPAGAAADRRSRKAAMMLSDGISALLAIAVIAACRRGSDSLIFYLAILAARSAAAGIQTPAADSAVPLLAPEGALEKANSIRGLMSALISFVSPVAAGFLMPYAGLSGMMAIDAVTAAAAVSALVFISVPESVGTERVTVAGGFRFIFSEKRILRLLAFHAIALMLISPGASLTPLLVSRVFGDSPSLLSASEASYSLGMVAGGAAAAALSGRVGRRTMIALPLSVYGIILAAMGLASSFPLYLALNAVIGLIAPGYTAFLMSALQEMTPPGMMGRVMAAAGIISVSGVPIGLAVSAPLSDAFPVEAVFIAAGILTFLHAAAGGRLWLRSF